MDQWMINGEYSAGKKHIDGILKIISRLQVSAPVPGSIRSEIISRLEKEGRRVRIVAARKNPHVILMYHDTIHTRTTYMMMEHSGQPFRVIIPGYPETDLERYFSDEISYWRDNSIFRLKENQIRFVSVCNNHDPGKSFHLINDFKAGYKLFTYSDSTEITGIINEPVMQYLGYFSSVYFERFLTRDEKNDLIHVDPEYIITVEDTDNRTIRVVTFPWYVAKQDGHPLPDLNRLIAIINDSDTVMVKYVELDPVIKEIGYFLESI
jgi:hypothetical protein